MMKGLLFAVSVSGLVMVSLHAKAENRIGISVIPKPNKIEVKSGEFSLTPNTRIILPDGDENLQVVAEQLASRLRAVTGYPFEIVRRSGKSSNTILLTANSKEEELESEGYELNISKEAVSIKGRTPAGVFYGVQTFYQLLPPEVEKNGLVPGKSWSVPCIRIEDQPRFRWRGMHLDVARHFFPKEFVKKYIDVLASYKMNTFHWHLTDDQGWRIEIKKYPRLTQIGSQRKETMGDCKPYGGFYTQDEIREIVRYAKERFITIVPEIEMPGHCLAALASYPELSCSGGPFNVGTEWGVINDVYCAGSEKTFEFLEDVIDEVSSLFPGQFFHIGGDECPKIRWSNCVRCQNRIKAEGLKDEHELQSYFIKRIEKILNARRKRLIGWDEILEGGLAPNATVMSWRGVQGGIEAAKASHDVVMTPTSHCYFDYFQGVAGEPRTVSGFLPIDTVYSFEPVPGDLSADGARHILGAQGNVWTEWMPDSAQVEFMVLPRLCAMSEVLWTEQSRRDLRDFTQRLEKHYDRFVARDLNFRVPTPLGIGGTRVIFGDTLVAMKSPVSTATIYYALDGNDPTPNSTKYLSPIYIQGDQILKALLLLANGKMSNPVTTSFFLVDQKLNGLNYAYYEGEWEKLPDLKQLTPLASGRAYDISLEGIAQREENFGIHFAGFIGIEREGEYTFYTASDDGSKLLIDDKEVVNNDGLHGTTEASGKIMLASGKHKINILYFQRGGDKNLDVSFEGPQVLKQHIPPRLLFHSE
jgi:hexosaminidase